MPFWQVYLACAAGVVLSVAIPVLSKSVRQYFGTGRPAEFGGAFHLIRTFWHQVRPYRILITFSLAVAALVIAFLGDKLTTWRTALIAGYVWDSTLQKITTKP